MRYKLLLVLIFLFSSSILLAEHSKIFIAKNVNRDFKVNLMNNGGFIELLMDFTNGYMGLWAQELLDRGVDDYLSNKTLNKWEIFSDNGRVDVIKGGYNKKGKYQIGLSSHNGLPVGIAQKVHLSDRSSHHVYFYAMCPEIGKVKILLLDTNYKELTSCEIEIHSQNWKKYEVDLPIINGLNKCIFKFEYSGLTLAYFDEFSLMPNDNILGIRKEYSDLFNYWKPSILRYPGGWFADSEFARWSECLYDIDSRISPNNFGFAGYQRLDFSFEEYMKICKRFSIEPLITVNYENGSTKEAAEWIEYANSDTNTFYGYQRYLKGSYEPYRIKFWEIGNEQWYKPEIYAERYNQYYDRMKAIDPSIKIIANGNHYDPTSFPSLMKIIKNKSEYLGYHPQKGINKSKKASDLEKYLCMVGNDFFESHVLLAYQDSIEQSLNPQMRQCITEWWSSNGIGNNDWLLDTNIRNRSLETGLWNAIQMMIYYRNSNILDFATRTIGLGLIGRATNSNNQKLLYYFPSLHAMAMLRNHIGEKVASSIAECGTYNVDNIEVWTPLTKWLEVLSTYDDDSLYIAVVNRHPSEGLTNEFIFNNSKLKNFTAKVYELSSDHYLDYNSADFPDKITPKEKLVYVDSSYVFPKHSLTILAIPINFTGIPNDDFEVKLNFYPNPSSNIINVNYLNSEDIILEYKVFDIYGNLITSNKINDNLFSIDISNLATGCYWIQFRTEKGVYSKSFIKIL